MIKKISMLIAAALLTCSAQEIVVPANLKNQKGWAISNGKFVRPDNKIKLSKGQALRIENGAHAVRTLMLEKGKQYYLEFSVKGENLEKGARIILNSPGIKRWYPVSSRTDKRVDKGTFNWKNGAYLVDPKVLGGTKLTMTFKNYGKGTAWFDKITLSEISTTLPGGWKNVYATKIFTDKEVKLSDSSYRFDNFGRMEKLFTLEEGAEYEVSFYVKGENIKGNAKEGAQVLICGGDRKAWARAATNQKKGPESGTFDWKKGSFRFTHKYFKSNKVYVMPTLNAPGKAWFDRIELKKIREVQTKASFRDISGKDIKTAAFYPGGTAGFFNPGEKISLNLELAGKGAYTCTVKVKNFSTGKEICAPLAGSIKAPGKAAFTLPGQKNGYYVAEAQIFQNKKRAGRIQCGFVVAPEFGKRDSFFQFGFGTYAELHDAYKRVGAGSVVIGLKSMDMTKDAIRYVTRQLKANKIFLESKQFEVNISVGATLRRHSDPKAYAAGIPVLTDKMVSNITKGLELAAAKTKGIVKEWCVGTEIPSGATIPRYVGTWCESMFNSMVITRMASRIAKKSDPSIKIFWGGNNIQRYTESIDRIVFGDIVKEVDGYFIDAYTGNWDMTRGGYSIPEQSLRSFYRDAAALSESMGKGKRIRNNETGYAINYGSPYDSGLSVPQAELTARTIILTKAADLFCFELHMPTYRSWNMKILKDSDRWMTTIWKPIFNTAGKIVDVPLPGGAAYTTAARHLSFAKIREEAISGANYVCIFTKPNGKTLAAVWNTDVKTELQFDLPQDTNVTDMVGSDSVLKKGKCKLMISPAPVYLENNMKPAALAALLKKAFAKAAPPMKAAAKRHDEKTMTVFVQNPGGDLADVAFRCDGKICRRGKAVPGLSTFRVPISQKLELISNGKVYPVEQDKRFIRVKKLARKPVFDGSGSWIKGLPVNKLRVPDDVYPKTALQPERAYFKSSFNPDGHDFSVDYFLAYDNKNLYIAVKANDLKHLNNVNNGWLWDGDSIQWVLTGKDIPPGSVRSVGMRPQDFISQYNFGLARTPNGTEYRKFLSKGGHRSYPCRITRKNGITFYEAALPWNATDFKPGKGQALRFSLVVFDKARASDKGASYCLALTPGVSGGMDAGYYRLLLLDK